MRGTTRRAVLAGAASVALTSPIAARSLKQEIPWEPNEAFPPPTSSGDGLHFLTKGEAATIDAVVERLIPSDALGPGGREAGCTAFIDRQLAGGYGTNAGLYMEAPFADHVTAAQGLQSRITPRVLYRQGIAALEAHCRANYSGRSFDELKGDEQDAILGALEDGKISGDFDAKAFFSIVHANAMEGFFSDPIYGGNRDMAGWKLVGFPGTRYDYRDVMDRPNAPYDMAPVSIQGRKDWNGSE